MDVERADVEPGERLQKRVDLAFEREAHVVAAAFELATPGSPANAS